MINSICKCDTGKNYLDCCGAYITNVKVPETPEQLMRSRYTAFATGNIDYIAKTMSGQALGSFTVEDDRLDTNEITWM